MVHHLPSYSSPGAFLDPSCPRHPPHAPNIQPRQQSLLAVFLVCPSLSICMFLPRPELPPSLAWIPISPYLVPCYNSGPLDSCLYPAARANQLNQSHQVTPSQNPLEENLDLLLKWYMSIMLSLSNHIFSSSPVASTLPATHAKPAPLLKTLPCPVPSAWVLELRTVGFFCH